MNTPENLITAQTLKLYRVTMGMRAKTAATYLEQDQGNYSKMENGYRPITPYQLARIKKLFDIWRELQIEKLKNEIKRLEEIK